MFLRPQAEGRCGKGIQCSQCSSLPCSGPWTSLELERGLGANAGSPVPIKVGHLVALQSLAERRGCRVMFPCPGNGSWKNFVNLPGH